MTLGGYDVENSVDTSKHSLVGHPVAGSFHWSLHLVKIGMGDDWMKTTVPHALTDTGTTYLYLP